MNFKGKAYRNSFHIDNQETNSPQRKQQTSMMRQNITSQETSSSTFSPTAHEQFL